jgi:CRISPR/Cas system-associated endonuclease Cas1
MALLAVGFDGRLTGRSVRQPTIVRHPINAMLNYGYSFVSIYEQQRKPLN